MVLVLLRIIQRNRNDSECTFQKEFIRLVHVTQDVLLQRTYNNGSLHTGETENLLAAQSMSSSNLS